jgi:hypothetical protein
MNGKFGEAPENPPNSNHSARTNLVRNTGQTRYTLCTTSLAPNGAVRINRTQQCIG